MLHKSSNPTVITLCGSTKFKHMFLVKYEQFTLQYKIVLAPGVYAHTDGQIITSEQKKQLNNIRKK